MSGCFPTLQRPEAPENTTDKTAGPPMSFVSPDGNLCTELSNVSTKCSNWILKDLGASMGTCSSKGFPRQVQSMTSANAPMFFTDSFSNVCGEKGRLGLVTFNSK